MPSGRVADSAPFVAEFDAQGAFLNVRDFPGFGHRVAALVCHRVANKSVLVLVTTADKASHVYDAVDSPPQKAGLVLALLDVASLNAQLVRPLSTGDRLVADVFWDFAHVHAEDSLFLVVKRQTVTNWVHTFVPTVFKIDVASLRPVAEPRALPNDLQNHVALYPDEKGIFLAYVSRVLNREGIVVRRLATNLTDLNWDAAETPVFRRPIEMDAQYTRSIRSDVADMLVAEQGQVHVLLHTAEIIDPNQTDTNDHRKLSNGRPALLVLTNAQAVANISQSVTNNQWQPHAMAVDTNRFYIVGEHRGLIGSDPDAAPSMLLTSVERPALPTPSPSPSPGANDGVAPDPAKGSGSGASDGPGAASNETCVGASTAIGGRAFKKLLEEDARLRLQRHPLFELRAWLGLAPVTVPMLCLSWRNATESESGTLCATAGHVLRWHGKPVFMHELCRAVGHCRQRQDEPLNFKGACGVDVVAHKFLAVTMHASRGQGVDAREVVRDECAQMQKTPLRWLVSTL
ncbi:unnamed protein product [Chondrus crispus]|uniref:Uncharacterized protein n=1 Tax=Chondrus crispus TaxID=2769 RepID=R7QRH7_CHOCR|nr:unnamed protein product [Chondrus crispus]CDF40353.1 unnamed protein product [Chondrus crispus]|eukprot:XP_005710647.1 unnamed protein product [Chondrus crispus]